MQIAVKATKMISQTYHLTLLEASELFEKSQALSNAFIALRNAYSIDFLTETRNFVNRKQANENQSGATWIIARISTRLSKEAREMWGTFTACEKTLTDLQAVYHAHPIEGTIDEVITKTFQIRHETGDLGDPEKVVEGRRVYETLARDQDLREHIGHLGF